MLCVCSLFFLPGFKAITKAWLISCSDDTGAALITLQGEHQHRDELTFGVALSSQSEYEADLNIKLMAQRKNRIAAIVGLGKKKTVISL